jgi:hypothetical protein
MTTMTSSIRPSDLKRSLDLIEVKPGVRFSLAVLKDMLPDVETCLFFGKVYELDAQQLGALLHKVLKTDLTSALFAEGHTHSNDLQDYLVGYEDEFGDWVPGIVDPSTFGEGDISFKPDVPKGEILPEVWASLEVEVAQSIKDVAAKLESVVAKLPGKQGQMVFQSMAKLNARRPVVGDFRAAIQHERQQTNLVILDVSGSMSADTIRRIIDDVVALSYAADAAMAVVSNTTTFWEPGSYGVDDVLRACEFAGTKYETLAPLFDRDWGVVITVADYDSSYGAKEALARCPGRIEQLLDVSLVNRPTFLAECVGQRASEVKPLLIGSSGHVLV